MDKIVRVDTDRRIKISDNGDIEKPIRQIKEMFVVDELEGAHYTMKQDDLFTFEASLDVNLEQEMNNKKLVFIIDIEHPLYFAFLHLLDNEKEFNIQDMRTEEKYLNIRNEDDNIVLNFVDNLKNEDLNNKFSIIFDNNLNFIKNKKSIKNNAKKNRLNNFFNEASLLLFEDSHQISIEEYDVRKKVLERRKNAS
jgi:hypothetical protein